VAARRTATGAVVAGEAMNAAMSRGAMRGVAAMATSGATNGAATEGEHRAALQSLQCSLPTVQAMGSDSSTGGQRQLKRRAVL
jgi:hypothetical protein